MARTLLSLAREMDGYARDVDEAINELKQLIARTLVNQLVWATPVDTSRALSNWRAELGTSVSNWIEAHYPGEQGSTQAASAQAAINEAESVIARAKPGETISIFNAVPYIRYLNEGSSSQAPAGFVEASQIIAERLIKTRGIRLRKRR